MTPHETTLLKEAIFIAMTMYGKEPTPDQIILHANMLSDLPWPRLQHAFDQYMKDPRNKTAPLPAQIRALADPSQNPEHEITATVTRVISSVSRFGSYNGEKARMYIGEVGWQCVRDLGGWRRICESLGDKIPVGIFTAALRRQLEMYRAVDGSIDSVVRPQIGGGDVKDLTAGGRGDDTIIDRAHE